MANNRGLSEKDAAALLNEHGPNVVEVKSGVNALKIIFDQFKSPFVIMLILSAIITYFIKQGPETIAIFAILSVLTLFFIQYLFMATTREQYPVAEDMAGFLGLFTGSMMIFILIVKLVVFPYVLRNYGVRILR